MTQYADFLLGLGTGIILSGVVFAIALNRVLVPHKITDEEKILEDPIANHQKKSRRTMWD